jgi:hypothetical protein
VATVLNSDLPQFLADGAAQPFVWGQCDCCLWPASWILLQTGVDPAAALRGSYSTRAGAYRLIMRAGGLQPLARSLAATAGLPETTDPLPGDVGLVFTGERLALAIKTRVGWACKSQKGIVAGLFPMVVAWRVSSSR